MDNEIANLNKKPLMIVLGILICLIIILVVANVLFFTNNRSKSESSPLIDTSQVMPDTEYGDVSDSTKAFALSQNIAEKLASDPDYNPEQAIAEYSEIYQQATGDLKVYVAIEWAYYVNETFADPSRAIEILEAVDGLTENSELDYYSAMLNLYTAAGDQAKIDEYQKIVDEKTPVINLKEEDAF